MSPQARTLVRTRDTIKRGEAKALAAHALTRCDRAIKLAPDLKRNHSRQRQDKCHDQNAARFNLYSRTRSRHTVLTSVSRFKLAVQAINWFFQSHDCGKDFSLTSIVNSGAEELRQRSPRKLYRTPEWRLFEVPSLFILPEISTRRYLSSLRRFEASYRPIKHAMERQAYAAMTPQ